LKDIKRTGINTTSKTTFDKKGGPSYQGCQSYHGSGCTFSVSIDRNEFGRDRGGRLQRPEWPENRKAATNTFGTHDLDLSAVSSADGFNDGQTKTRAT
jgi:hypothetical protein